MPGIVRKADLVKKGVEVLSIRAGSAEGRKARAEEAVAYARLAEALGDDAFYGEI